MEALPHQPQGVQGGSPGQGDSKGSVAVVVDHGNPAAPQLRHLPLHPRILPARPQTDPPAQDFSFADGRLQPAAALQDALRLAVVHLQSPVPLLPRAADGDPVYAGVDVGLSICILDEMLQPGGLHLEDLTSDGVHLVVTHQQLGAQAGAVDDDVIAVAQFLQTVDLPLFHLTSSCYKPLQHMKPCRYIKSVLNYSHVESTCKLNCNDLEFKTFRESNNDPTPF